MRHAWRNIAAWEATAARRLTPHKTDDDVELTYWYLFPIAILIAGLANGAGVGGATFFSPMFILGLRLEPAVAIGTALITEVFGFASGVIGHARAGTIDWKLVGLLASVSVPAAAVGSLLAGFAPETALKVVLGVGLIAIAFVFMRHHDPDEEDEAISMGIDVVEPFIQRRLIARDRRVYEYRLCRRTEGRIFAGIGGLFVGLISTGLGEVNSFTLVKRCRVPSRVAVAVSVTVVAVTALVASVVYLIDFATATDPPFDDVLSIALFTVPGVVIGGQLGPQVVSHIPEQRLIHGLGWIFLIVAGLTLGEAAFG